LANDYPNQVSAPPKKPPKDATDEQVAVWEQKRHAQSSQRICVEQGIAKLKAWRLLQRYIGRREYLPEIIQAITGIASDRALPA
jgi:hypothetical protein